jgi:hypothetical protein
MIFILFPEAGLAVFLLSYRKDAGNKKTADNLLNISFNKLHSCHSFARSIYSQLF